MITAAWVATNLLWIRAFRWTRYAELDEAAYLAITSRLARFPWHLRWQVLQTEGVHGPLQGLLGAPMMRIAGVTDLRILIGLNVLLVAVAALATASLTRRLAGQTAGTIAGVVVLLSPAVIDFSHTALTAVAPMCGAALALLALSHSEGLRRPGWSFAAGLAIAFMVLGRSMAIGFVPAVGFAGLGWAWSARTPWPQVIRNGALVVAAAGGGAAWWWWIRWDAVSAYLFEGGSSDTERLIDPVSKTSTHLVELLVMIGPVVLVVATVAVVLQIRGARRPTPPAPRLQHDHDGATSGPITLWPLVVSLGVGLAALGASSAPGVGFTLPLLPGAVAAGTAAIRRAGRSEPQVCRAATVATIAVGLISAASLSGRGLSLDFPWCTTVDTRVRVYCAIEDNAQGLAWQQANEAVADRIVMIDAAMAADGVDIHQDLLAMTPRDVGVNYNTVGLALELRHHSAQDLHRYFRPDEPADGQVARAVQNAAMIVAVEDPPGEAILGIHAPPTGEVMSAAHAGGFRDCENIDMPDGRSVTILVADWVPDDACKPVSGG